MNDTRPELPKILAIDFDGCLCTNRWPEIGEPNYAVILAAIGRRVRRGWKLILWTCRTGEKLTEAVDWCRRYGLEFDAVNANLPEVIEAFGADCRKITATEYWDDCARRMRAEEVRLDDLLD